MMSSSTRSTSANQGLQDLKDRVLQTVDTGPNTFAKSPSRYFRLFRFLHRFNLTVHPSLAEFLDKVDFQGHVFVG